MTRGTRQTALSAAIADLLTESEIAYLCSMLWDLCCDAHTSSG